MNISSIPHFSEKNIGSFPIEKHSPFSNGFYLLIRKIRDIICRIFKIMFSFIHSILPLNKDKKCHPLPIHFDLHLPPIQPKPIISRLRPADLDCNDDPCYYPIGEYRPIQPSVQTQNPYLLSRFGPWRIQPSFQPDNPYLLSQFETERIQQSFQQANPYFDRPARSKFSWIEFIRNLLPKRMKYSSWIIGSIRSHSNDPTCNICYEEPRWIKSYLFHQATDNSKHIFHKNCLERWLQEKKTCPTCRAPLNERNLIILDHIPLIGNLLDGIKKPIHYFVPQC